MSSMTQPAERAPFVGPIFFWELVRQSRKGRGYLTRVVYALAVFGVLFLMMGVDDITQKNAAYLSERTVFLYLIVQYAAVVILTPIYVAGAFIEDRQQNTLQLLLTTFMTPREIVLGKLCGRLIYVLGTLLVGLPVLALLQLFGGVDLWQLLLHTGLALVLMAVCGMYAIRASTLCKTVGGAIVMTYTMLAGGYLATSVIAVPLMVFLAIQLNTAVSLVMWWGTVILLNVVFAMATLRRAIRLLRDYEKDRDVGRMQLMNEAVLPDLLSKVIVVDMPITAQKSVMSDVRVPFVPATPAATVRIHKAVRWKRLPAVWDWPVVWKETWFPPSEVDALLAGICCGLPLTVFFSSFVTHETFQSVRPFIWWCAEALMALLIVLTTLRAAGSFGQERLQQTLLSLLSVPRTRMNLIGQVWLGSLLRFYAFAIGTGLIVLAVGVYSPFFLARNLPLFLSQLAFFILLGVYLSLTRLTPFQARFGLATYFFVSYFVLPFFLRNWPEGTPAFVIALLCPYYTWYQPRSLELSFLDVTAEMFLVTWVMIVCLLVLAERMLKRLQERL